MYMPGEAKRPGNTAPFIIPCSVTFTPGPKDIIDYCKVDNRGYPIFRRPAYASKKATVIVGHREKDNLTVSPEDKVFSCVFGPKGHLSSVGKDLENQELTVIIHNTE